MRNLCAFVLFVLFYHIGFGQEKWKKEKIQLPLTVCYASDESSESFVGRPAEYYQRLKSASLQSADIEVTYEGFTAEARQAFQYAVDIWKNLIQSPVPIRIKANWRSLDPGVLGSCGPAGYYKNFDATQHWDTYYPVSLVEKMMGEEVNAPTQFDMYADFNKDFSNWYLGTDGKTPSLQYDFVSVVLHELTHGLGFTGLMSTNEGKGIYNYGNDPLPGVFDRHIINNNSQYLVNKSVYTNPSIALQLALTSNWLKFYTSLTGSTLPRLYAPATWNEGSSIYHLDDNTYPRGNVNSLMTPFTGKGEAIHNPGPEALAIMYEMGWKSITVKHQPIKDMELVAQPISFTARIVSDEGLDLSKLYLVYSVNRFTGVDSVLMNSTDITDSYSVLLSKFKSGEVDYFFSATDLKGRRFVYPSNAPKRYLSFKIGVDRQLPVIQHEAVKFMLSSHPSVQVKAEITDNLGVRSAYVEYFITGGSVKQLPMQNIENSTYSATLAFPRGSLKGGEKINYRIVATDASSQSNMALKPLSGYYSLTVEEVKAPGVQYVNNFNTTSSDFIGTEFFVSTPPGFDSRALNTSHPYLSPDEDNLEYNYTTILRQPLILKNGGKMSYDEVVLVEPADSGVKFGDEDFWDYVIVEGSKDGGNSWHGLIDGYDSNYQPSWRNLYESSISGNNSTATPTRSNYFNHEIDLLANQNFVEGDTILIRFRLFSDPYSHGWGWIIDNMKIQDGIINNILSVLSEGEISLYPNPAHEVLNISVKSQNTIGLLVVKAYNAMGSLVYNNQWAAENKDFHTTIDVSGLSGGLYLFTIEDKNGQQLRRKILIR